MGVVFNKHLTKMHFFDDVTEKVVSVDVSVVYYKKRDGIESIIVENAIRRGRDKIYRIGRLIECWDDNNVEN